MAQTQEQPQPKKYGLLSAEAAIALVVAFINLALDQADIHIMLISWISVLTCIVLCVDVLRRTTWVAHTQYGRRRLAIGSSTITLVFVAFGIFLSVHKGATEKEAGVKIPYRAVPTPVHIDFDTVGILPGVIGVEDSVTAAQVGSMNTEGPLKANPGQAVIFTIDREFPNAEFIILCDRPCQATSAVIFNSIYFTSRPLHTDEAANITLIRIETPTLLEPRSKVGINVRSRDSGWIHVLQVERHIPTKV
jgi:uncharacterized membrane protein